jgi:hypothetical protein
MRLIFDQTWERDAPEALIDGRVEFVPFNFLEESPVVGKDVYYVCAKLLFPVIASSSIIWYS